MDSYSTVLAGFQVVEPHSSLHSLTKDRPRPPVHRRPPSRQRSPSPSPTHTITTSTVERIGGITTAVQDADREPFVYDAANRMLNSCTPIVSGEVRER